MSEYEAKTHYQNTDTATRYATQFSTPLSIANFRTKLVGWGEVKAFTNMLMKISGAESALDVACGTGRYLEILLNYGYQVGGVDISDEMLSFSRQRLKGEKNLLFIRQGDAEKLPFETHKFDLVTCMRLYHRIPNKIRRQMLHEVKRVGKGHAILFFGMSTPWLKLRGNLRTKLIPGRSSNPFPLTQHQLTTELEAIGLKIQNKLWVLPFLSGGQVVYVTWQ